MHIRQFFDPASFDQVVSPLLMKREAENNLMLGLIDAVQAGRYPQTLMAAVQQDERIVAAVMMTPPRPMIITRFSTAAIQALLTWLQENQTPLPGVVGSADDASALAAQWISLTGGTTRPGMELGVYALDRVLPPRPASGRFRQAAMDDVDRIMPFIAAFAEEIGEPIDDSRGQTEGIIAEQRLVAWCDPDPVSIAACGGPTPNGIRINRVYTPPALRGRGYASNCVAALSQRLLDAGRRFCFLFTDLKNPTSNGIYRRIGYRHVCDFRQVFFPGR